MNTEKHLVTWDMFQIHARKLAETLQPAKQWKAIIAVTRGGLFPAAVISRELNIRHVETVCVSSYEHDKQGNVNILHKPDVGDGEGYLIIDDLVDSGNTLRALRKVYPKAYFVTVFAKPNGIDAVDRYLIDIPQDTWIEQPWDLGLSFIPPLERK